MKCSQFARLYVCMYVCMYIHHTLIAWAWFLWSRPTVACLISDRDMALGTAWVMTILT